MKMERLHMMEPHTKFKTMCTMKMERLHMMESHTKYSKSLFMAPTGVGKTHLA